MQECFVLRLDGARFMGSLQGASGALWGMRPKAMSHWLPESFINGPIKHSLKLSIAVIQFSFKLFFFSFGLTVPQLKSIFRESQQGTHLKTPKPRTLVCRCQLHGGAGGLLPSAPRLPPLPELQNLSFQSMSLLFSCLASAFTLPCTTGIKHCY